MRMKRNLNLPSNKINLNLYKRMDPYFFSVFKLCRNFKLSVVNLPLSSQDVSNLRYTLSYIVQLNRVASFTRL
jgi:hypothetical protein